MGVTALILLIYCDGDKKTPYQKGLPFLTPHSPQPHGYPQFHQYK